MGLETVESQYLEGRSSLNCADNTAAEIDTEVSVNMLKECYEEALAMLRENRDVMDQIAVHLIEKETITGKEFMKIYREAKGLPEPEEKKDEIAVKEKSVLTEETGETEKKEEVHIPAQSGFPTQAQQSAYTAQQPQKPWRYAARVRTGIQKPRHKGRKLCSRIQNLNPQQRNQDAQPQNGLAPAEPAAALHRYRWTESAGNGFSEYHSTTVLCTTSTGYGFISESQPEETAQPPYTGAQPEDNGSNQETSRFGALWDRTVNGDRNNNSHNHGTDGSFNSESERYNRSFRSDLRERILSAQFIEGVHIEARRVLPFVDIWQDSQENCRKEKIEMPDTKQELDENNESEVKEFDVKRSLANFPKSPASISCTTLATPFSMWEKPRIYIIVCGLISKENIGREVQIDKMVSLIARFEYIVTDSELEALVLENNLIKEYSPEIQYTVKGRQDISLY